MENNQLINDSSDLTLFLEECLKNQNIENKLFIKRLKLIRNILTVLIGVIISTYIHLTMNVINASIVTFIISTIIFSVHAYIFLSIIEGIIVKFKPVQNIAEINFKPLDNFLQKNQLNDFSEILEPYCIETGKTNKINLKKKKKEEKEDIKTIIYIFASMILYFVLTIIFATKNNINITENLILFIIMDFLFAICVAGFSLFLLPYIKKIKKCNHQIDAVCIQVDSKHGKDSTIYKPYYYINYNNKGYILFENSYTNAKVPEIGNIETDVYINPENPFEYKDSSSKLSILIGSLFIMCFSIIPIFVLTSVILGTL